MKIKKIASVCCILMCFIQFGYTQPVSTQTIKQRIALTKTTVVKDTAGKQYQYAEWTTLLSSHKYGIKPTGEKSADGTYTAFIIYPLYNAKGEPVINSRMEPLSPGNMPPAAVQQYRTEVPFNPKPYIPAKPAESDRFHAGDAFAPFNEKDINGEKFNLKKDKGKVYVINFWFIGCPPCRAEIPDLNNLVEHYKDNKDVVFIAICLDQTSEIKDFTKYTPYNYHIISDGRYVAAKYGVQLYPTNLVVNREGKVAYSSVSNQLGNYYWIPKIIDEALAAAPPVTEIPKSK